MQLSLAFNFSIGEHTEFLSYSIMILLKVGKAHCGEAD
jgi:hypothetical protein